MIFHKDTINMRDPSDKLGLTCALIDLGLVLYNLTPEIVNTGKHGTPLRFNTSF